MESKRTNQTVIKRKKVTTIRQCPNCGGSGNLGYLSIYQSMPLTCGKCHGKGELRETVITEIEEIE